jgi:hypothetical protein
MIVVAIETTTRVPKRRLILVPDATGQSKALLNAPEKSRLEAPMQASLGDDDTSVLNTNRFALRRVSEQSQFEFRDGNLRAFYRIVEDNVHVDAVGRKTNNQLLLVRTYRRPLATPIGMNLRGIPFISFATAGLLECGALRSH